MQTACEGRNLVTLGVLSVAPGVRGDRVLRGEGTARWVWVRAVEPFGCARLQQRSLVNKR